MASWRIAYSETCRSQIRFLAPSIKPIIKQRIEEFREDPYVGRPLERELSGIYSYRARRFRILYAIDSTNHTIQVHYVGHRKDVYELFRDLLAEMHETGGKPAL
jgi:mRNA-degrading endonuclease RelE of RelBE toxin-antitoxin system